MTPPRLRPVWFGLRAPEFKNPLYKTFTQHEKPCVQPNDKSFEFYEVPAEALPGSRQLLVANPGLRSFGSVPLMVCGTRWSQHSGCLRLCLCLYIYTRTYIYTYIYIFTHIHTSIYIYIWMKVPNFISIYIYVYEWRSLTTLGYLRVWNSLVSFGVQEIMIICWSVGNTLTDWWDWWGYWKFVWPRKQRGVCHIRVDGHSLHVHQLFRDLM